MPRRVYLAAILGLVVVVFLSFGLSASAAPGEDGAREDEVALAQERLARMRMEADMAGQAHASAAFQLEELDEEIAAVTRDLEAAEGDLAEAQGRLEERAAQMYKSGNVGFVDVLVGAEDFSDFANRLELWMMLLARERAEYDKVRGARDEIAGKKAELEERRRQRAGAVEEAASQKDRTAGLEDEAQAYLDGLNDDLREAMKAEQARAAELAKDKGEELRAELVQQAGTGGASDIASRSSAATPVEETAANPPATPSGQNEVETEPSEATVTPSQNLLAERAAEEQRREERRARLAAESAAAEQREAEQYAAEQAAAAEAAREEARLAEERAAAEEAAAARKAAAESERRARLAEQAAREQYEKEQAAQQQYEEEQQAAQQQQQQYGQGPSGEQYDAADQGGGGFAPSTGAAGAQPSSPAPSPSGAGGGTASGEAVVAEAAKYMGTPYVLGGTAECVPYEAMDCNCLTAKAYEPFGFSLPDGALEAQMSYGVPVEGPPQAGDILFWSEDGSGVITHTGIATGRGTTVHASVFAGYVTETPIEYIQGYVGARRLL